MSEHDEISAPRPVDQPLKKSRKPIFGRVLSALAIAFLLFDAGIKIVGLPIVGETSVQLGWTGDVNFWRGMGVLLLACTALYIWPRTTLVGAILLTGYLGGAIATQLRIGNPLFSHILFGVYLAIILWAGLWLRSPALRALILHSRERT
jgi:hypothetical protein